MKPFILAGAAALIFAGCTSSASASGWTSGPGAEGFGTARSACEQISRGNETNFITCMAGRGWTKPRR